MKTYEKYKRPKGNTDNFGLMLRLIRVRFYMTQEIFADLIGTSVSNIKSWELGYQLPSFENLERIVGAILDHKKDKDFNVSDEDVLLLEELYERGKAKLDERR